MLDRAGEDAICDTSYRARGIVLRVGEVGCSAGSGVLALEEAARRMEAAELDRNAGADADEWCEGAFIEGAWTFIFVDLRRALQRAGIVGCRLKSNLYNVCFLGELVDAGSVMLLLTKWLAWSWSQYETPLYMPRRLEIFW